MSENEDNRNLLNALSHSSAPRTCLHHRSRASVLRSSHRDFSRQIFESPHPSTARLHSACSQSRRFPALWCPGSRSLHPAATSLLSAHPNLFPSHPEDPRIQRAEGLHFPKQLRCNSTNRGSPSVAGRRHPGCKHKNSWHSSSDNFCHTT